MRHFRMKEDWDARARKNARFYIACDDHEDEDVFQASGQRDAAVVLDGVMPLLPARERVLEIGCGIGRLLEHMAPHFRQLYGVDISVEMVKQGCARLARLPHTELIHVDGNGPLPFANDAFDFCFSYITFHHIPHKEIISRYLEEARRVLRRGGIFRFQLFGLPEGFVQAVRERLTKKSTWRGCKFRMQEIISLTQQRGFEVVRSDWVDLFPGARRPFFGKNMPYAIWITARKPSATQVSIPA